MDRVINKNQYTTRLEPIKKTRIDILRKKIEEYGRLIKELIVDLEEIREILLKIESLEVKDKYTREKILSDIESVIVEEENIKVLQDETEAKFIDK